MINSLITGFNSRLLLADNGAEILNHRGFLFINDLNLLKLQGVAIIILFVSNVVLIFFLYFLFKAIKESVRSYVKRFNLFSANGNLSQEALRDFIPAGQDQLHFRLDDNVFTPQEKRKLFMLQMNLRADDKWEVFKKWFNETFPDFYLKLIERYPSLTPSDFRLLSLMKLNLTNKDMALRLGISIEGVKKSKQRLKKKLGIDLDDLLEEVC